jgi:hypothetical protein
MARNEEKAQALLNKWVTMKKEWADGEWAGCCDVCGAAGTLGALVDGTMTH